jgi:hypothetical protein
MEVMRNHVVAIASLAICFLSTTFAHAQEDKPKPPHEPPNPTNYKGLNGDDLRDFCVFNDRVYSVGAWFCSLKHMALQCTQENPSARARWTHHAEGYCDSNSSATPQ